MPHFDKVMNPCVRGGVATLASCKAKLRQRCRVGDFALVFAKIAGGRLLFCMRVDSKVPYSVYCDSGRPDALYTHADGAFTRRQGGVFGKYHRTSEDWAKDTGGEFALRSEHFSSCSDVPADSPLRQLACSRNYQHRVSEADARVSRLLVAALVGGNFGGPM